MGDVHHPGLVSCGRGGTSRKAMWERDPASRVLAGQGGSEMIRPENLS